MTHGSYSRPLEESGHSDSPKKPGKGTIQSKKGPTVSQRRELNGMRGGRREGRDSRREPRQGKDLEWYSRSTVKLGKLKQHWGLCYERSRGRERGGNRKAIRLKGDCREELVSGTEYTYGLPQRHRRVAGGAKMSASCRQGSQRSTWRSQ